MLKITNNLGSKILQIFTRDILVYVTNLFTGVVIARNLGPNLLGIWVILLMIPSYAEAFGRLKTDIASVYFIGKKIYKEEEILFNLNSISIISSLVIIFLIFINMNKIELYLFGDLKHTNKIFLCILQIPINFILLNYNYFHLAHENIKIYNRITLINAWTNTFLILIFLIYFKLGVYAMILSFIIAPFISLIYAWYNVDRSKWGHSKINLNALRSMISYGKYFYISGIFAQLQENGVKTISLIYITKTNIAFLGQSQTLGKFLNRIPDAINTILFSIISNNDEEYSFKLSCKAFRISLISLLLGGTILFFSSNFIILFLFGVAYLKTAILLKILIPGIVIMGSSSVLISYFNGTGRANKIMFIQILPVFIQIFLAYYLSKNYGIIGATYAISIGMLFYGFSIIIIFLKTINQRFEILIPKLSDFKSVKFIITTLIKK
jgi:O-antigen/teichoic acid export membrane protein